MIEMQKNEFLVMLKCFFFKRLIQFCLNGFLYF